VPNLLAQSLWEGLGDSHILDVSKDVGMWLEAIPKVIREPSSEIQALFPAI